MAAASIRILVNPMAQPDELDEQIDFFEESLRKLKTLYDQFFAGVRKVPPTVERARLDGKVHEMAKIRIRDNAKRFRYNTLVSRYTQYRELWSRQMREREEGPMDFNRRKAALEGPRPAAPPPPPPAESPRRGTSAVPESYVKVAPATAGEAIDRLYDQFMKENLKAGKLGEMNRDQVGAMIQKQADALRARYGVNAVAFRFEMVEGKIKLKARPVQD